jgi:hypothetical protein
MLTAFLNASERVCPCSTIDIHVVKDRKSLFGIVSRQIVGDGTRRTSFGYKQDYVSDPRVENEGIRNGKRCCVAKDDWSIRVNAMGFHISNHFVSPSDSL